MTILVPYARPPLGKRSGRWRCRSSSPAATLQRSPRPSGAARRSQCRKVVEVRISARDPKERLRPAVGNAAPRSGLLRSRRCCGSATACHRPNASVGAPARNPLQSPRDWPLADGCTCSIKAYHHLEGRQQPSLRFAAAGVRFPAWLQQSARPPGGFVRPRGRRRTAR